MASNAPPEPWHSFLSDIDDAATEDLALHCIGGFAVSLYYGLTRPTGDLYADRLTEMFVGVFQRLRLSVLDPYDLVLSKLPRNLEVDLEDAKSSPRRRISI